MKKLNLFAAVLLMMVVTLASCGAKKQVAASNNANVRSPFGQTFEMPCTIFDTKEDFAATGVYRGSYKKKDELQINALLKAKELIINKAKGVYSGMVSTYGQAHGNNNGNDVADKMNRALDFILDGMLNDANTVCLKWGEIESDGNMECYMAIQISKQELAQKTAQKVAENLTDDEKLRIDFQEKQFREEMEKRLQQYKENH